MLVNRSLSQCSPPSWAEPRPRTLPSGVALSPEAHLPHSQQIEPQCSAVSSTRSDDGQDRAEVLLMPSSKPAPVSMHEVADARKQMLEEGPGQADQDDHAGRAARQLGEVGIGRSPLGDRHQPPGEDGKPGDDKRAAGDAVEDRNRHVRAPSPDRQMRRKRSRLVLSWVLRPVGGAHRLGEPGCAGKVRPSANRS